MRFGALGEAAKGGEIEVIVVVVAEEDNVDARKIFKADAGRAITAGAYEAEWAGAVGPDGISENVDAAKLEEERGVVDHGDAEFVGSDGGGRFGGDDVVNEAAWGRFGRAVEFPAEDIAEAKGLGRVGVEEATTVEVGRVCNCAGEAWHEVLFTHR